MYKGRYFTKEIVLDTPAAGTHVLWRADHACQVKAVRAYRVGGSECTVNAQVNTDDLLAANLSLASVDTWLGGSSGLAADDVLTVAAGDTLKAEVVSATGVTELTIQIDLVYDADVH